MNIAIIPARGGSKRIGRKNIKNFHGKPMISYAITAAQNSGIFDKVIVSTEDEEIAEISKKYGAEIPFLRPQELSNDFIGTTPVVKHAIEWFADHGICPEYTTCIYATSPFLKADFLTQASEKLHSENCEYIFSVTAFPFPIQRAVKINKKGRVEAFNPEDIPKRSQDLEEAYHDAGQFYMGKTSAFLAEKEVLSPFSLPFILPGKYVQDIDTIDDWQRAEYIYQALVKNGDL